GRVDRPDPRGGHRRRHRVPRALVPRLREGGDPRAWWQGVRLGEQEDRLGRRRGERRLEGGEGPRPRTPDPHRGPVRGAAVDGGRGVSGIDLATGRWYVETALVRLLAKADELVEAAGEEALSRPPEVEGANSVFALITHCCGVMEHWGGEVIAGREVNRDRAAEFTATGTIASLEERVAAQLRRWRADMADCDAGEEPRGPVGAHGGGRGGGKHGFGV